MTTTVLSVPRRHRVTAVALEDISPLDLGAVAEVFGIDRDLTTSWYEFTVCAARRGQIVTRGGLRLAVDRDLREFAATSLSTRAVGGRSVM